MPTVESLSSPLAADLRNGHLVNVSFMTLANMIIPSAAGVFVDLFTTGPLQHVTQKKCASLMISDIQ